METSNKPNPLSKETKPNYCNLSFPVKCVQESIKIKRNKLYSHFILYQILYMMMRLDIQIFKELYLNSSVKFWNKLNMANLVDDTYFLNLRMTASIMAKQAGEGNYFCALPVSQAACVECTPVSETSLQTAAHVVFFVNQIVFVYVFVFVFALVFVFVFQRCKK